MQIDFYLLLAINLWSCVRGHCTIMTWFLLFFWENNTTLERYVSWRYTIMAATSSRPNRIIIFEKNDFPFLFFLLWVFSIFLAYQTNQRQGQFTKFWSITKRNYSLIWKFRRRGIPLVFVRKWNTRWLVKVTHPPPPPPFLFFFSFHSPPWHFFY